MKHTEQDDLNETLTLAENYKGALTAKESGECATSAALLSFSNETKKLRRRASVRGIRARLTYYKRDGIQEFRRIDSGCWIGQAYRYADLEVGDIAYLIASIQGNGQAATVGNPRQSVARYSEDHTVVDDLPEGTYEIKVDLIGEDGEYAETYWFQLDVCEQLKVKRINQRAA